MSEGINMASGPAPTANALTKSCENWAVDSWLILGSLGVEPRSYDAGYILIEDIGRESPPNGSLLNDWVLEPLPLKVAKAATPMMMKTTKAQRMMIWNLLMGINTNPANIMRMLRNINNHTRIKTRP